MLSNLIDHNMIRQLVVDAVYPYASVDQILSKNNIEADNALHLCIFLKHNESLTVRKIPNIRDTMILSEPQISISFMKGTVTDNYRFSATFLHTNCSALSIEIKNLDNFKATIDDFNQLFNKLENTIKNMFSSGVEVGGILFPWLQYPNDINTITHEYLTKGYVRLPAANTTPSVVLREKENLAREKENLAIEKKEYRKKINELFISKLEQKIENKNWLKLTFFSSDLKELHQRMKRHTQSDGTEMPDWYYPYQQRHPKLSTLLSEAEKEVNALKEIAVLKA